MWKEKSVHIIPFIRESSFLHFVVFHSISLLKKLPYPGAFLVGPERAQRPFPLNYPIAQADGAVKAVHGTGAAVFAVRIRSGLDGAGGAVLDTLILERWYLGKREQQLPSACGLPPRRSCGTRRKAKDHVPVIRGLYLQRKIAQKPINTRV